MDDKYLPAENKQTALRRPIPFWQMPARLY